MRLPRLVRPWMLVSAAWVVPAALAAVNQMAQQRLYGEPPASLRDILFASLDWFVYAFLTPAVFAISRRWPLTRPHLARRGVLHLVLALGFCVVWALAGQLLQLVLSLLLDPDGLQAALAAGRETVVRRTTLRVLSWTLITLPFGVAVYLCMVGMEHAIRYFVESREHAVHVARLAEQLTGARLAALQAQLNPHFLFNTLNTVAVFVREGDRAGAIDVIERLSDVLRRTLERARTSEVTAEEELGLVRQYLAIEQARFPDRLRPDLRIDEAVRTAAVPSFAVQTLVENAIRHGIAKRPGAGRVSVTVGHRDDWLEIAVADDGAGIDAARAALPGHGIENTRERLRALYGDRGSLVVAPGIDVGTVATLRVPYRDLIQETDDAAR